MSTLAEIEAAADALSPEQKQELLLYLVKRMRAQGVRLPEPQEISTEQISEWMADDDLDMPAAFLERCRSLGSLR